jgi:hypothetical protein
MAVLLSQESFAARPCNEAHHDVFLAELAGSGAEAANWHFKSVTLNFIL